MWFSVAIRYYGVLPPNGPAMLPMIERQILVEADTPERAREIAEQIARPVLHGEAWDWREIGVRAIEWRLLDIARVDECGMGRLGEDFPLRSLTASVVDDYVAFRRKGDDEYVPVSASTIQKELTTVSDRSRPSGLPPSAA